MHELGGHPFFLTSEGGDQFWALVAAFPTAQAALRAYNREYGVGWPDDTPTAQTYMRAAPEMNADDPDWHVRADGPGPATTLYWEFTA